MCVALIAGLLAAGGCEVGKTKMVLATRTNLGVSVETTPQPLAEISASRSEA